MDVEHQHDNGTDPRNRQQVERERQHQPERRKPEQPHHELAESFVDDGERGDSDIRITRHEKPPCKFAAPAGSRGGKEKSAEERVHRQPVWRPRFDDPKNEIPFQVLQEQIRHEKRDGDGEISGIRLSERGQDVGRVHVHQKDGKQDHYHAHPDFAGMFFRQSVQTPEYVSH